LGWIRFYDRVWLSDDVIAGLTASAVVIPPSDGLRCDCGGAPLAVGLYTGLVQHPEDESFPGLLKTEGMLHFANAQQIADLMWPLIHQYNPRVLVLDCSAIPDFEYTALKRLTEAEKKLQQVGISLWMAGLNPEPLLLIQRSALGQTLGRARMFFDVEQAVITYLRQSVDIT